MKSKNAKRIAAVAASLLMGLAFAGSGGVSYGSLPIISSAGVPVVQVVVGSGTGTQYTPSPSDGVVAANIAAVIGNLAFTSQAVTAQVKGAGGVGCVVVGPATCSLTNQQVWLGESGLSAGAGSYAFYAVIGSVLNGAVLLNQPGSTKLLQGSGQYAYPEVQSLTISPVMSPYSAATQVPFTSVAGSTTGGGVSFNNGFSATTNPNNDNLLRVTSTQLPALLSNWGQYGESSYIWVAGFPVFDQATGVNNFRLMSATGAYQVVFNTPIQINGTATAQAFIAGNLNKQIRWLGQNYTILKAYGAGNFIVGSSNTVNGGKIMLAAALTQPTTVYVGHNVTTGPFTVQLQDLGQPNSNGISPASVSIYYNGVLTPNTTSISPGVTQTFNISGQKLYVNVQSTFAGLYAYQKWAKIQVYSNILNFTDGQQYNQTYDPGWKVNLYWTNTTKSASANAVALQSIVAYNVTPVTLAPGQSLNFVQNPARWKVTFVGDTLTAAGFDNLVFTSNPVTSVTYQNLGTTGGDAKGLSITNITEPAAELTATSQLPTAFVNPAGITGSSVVYDLTTYQLNEFANAMQPAANQLFPAGNNALPAVGTSNVVLTYNAAGSSPIVTGNWISSTNPLTVTITGYTSNAASAPVSSTATFTSLGTVTANTANTMVSPSSVQFFNVTGIKLSRALPGPITVTVFSNAIANAQNTNVVKLASLANVYGGSILYQSSSTPQYLSSTKATTNVLYNLPNQQSDQVALTTEAGGAVNAIGLQQYYALTINEIAVPSSSSVAQTSYGFGIVNSSAGVAASPLFQLNYSNSGANTVGTKNNVTYISTNSQVLTVGAGFISERGSKFIGEGGGGTSLSFNMAKTPDTLAFVVGPINATATSSTTTYGPYKIGQATNIANVTIANVTASCTGGSSTTKACNVTGLSNLTAVPSVSQAVVPVHLNTATQPLVVLDTNANLSATLIVVGSKYVNSVAAQVFQQNPSLDSSFGPGSVIAAQEGSDRILVAGYTANQTVAAGNQFIGQLLADASQ